MKKVYLFFTVSFILTLLSCSKDNGNDTGVVTVEVDPTEEVTLNAIEVSQNIEIRGAIREQGNTPTPNGDITFTIDNSRQSAFQKNGFDIKFQAPADYAGAYIQLKGENGVASEYFDVPASTGKSTENEVLIDIDFINVAPGKFSYLLHIYNTNGFVSDPTEVAVKVEAWGGNKDLIGSWNYIKTIKDTNEVRIAEIEQCEELTVICSNGSEITIQKSSCETWLSLPLLLNEDGTYRYDEGRNYTKLDLQMTAQSCTAAYGKSGEYTSYSKGNWAFNADKNILTLIEFEAIEYDELSGIYGDYNYQNGKVHKTVMVNLNDNMLILENSEVHNGITSYYEYHYEKQ